MSNLALIQPRPVTFRTSQNADWLDGLPIIGRPGQGGVIAGSANVGNGGLAVTSVAVGAKRGVHVLRVTSVAGGLAVYSVTDPGGVVTAQGVAAGANMILVDFHPEPATALVDGPQALLLAELPHFVEDVGVARETYLKRAALAARYRDG